MLPLLLVAHGLCLNVRPRPSLRAATAARTLGLRHGGGPALCAPPPTPQVQGGPLREAAEGTMIDGLEVLDVEIGGEAPADFAALGMLRARVAANLSKSLANAVPFATYSSSVRVAHSSDKHTASTKLAPTLCAWHPPIIVSTGTPIHIASHVVVVPA